MTNHSIIRAQERANVSFNSAIKLIGNAKKFGSDSSRFPKKERTYMEQRTDENRKALCYENYIFILSDQDICITMFPLPDWFNKKPQFDGKKKIRNAKKYTRMMDFNRELIKKPRKKIENRP